MLRLEGLAVTWVISKVAPKLACLSVSMGVSLLEDLGVDHLSSGSKYFFHGELKDGLGFVQEGGVFEGQAKEGVRELKL